MPQASLQLPRWFNTILWGISIALSWMWGLGLFFSVQFTVQFGMTGLLAFAVPNALGLVAFGLITHHIARRSSGSESLALFFSRWSRPFRLAFFLYQILALTLTIFALLRYGWLPLGLNPQALFLPLTLLILLCAAFLFGEEFNIRRIKFSHGVLFLIAAAAMAFLALSVGTIAPATTPPPPGVTNDWNFIGYAVPIVIGFLIGPWLDLQQWQRAIQMHRERVGIGAAYIVGAVVFFGMLLFHGSLTLYGLSHGAGAFVRRGIADYPVAHDILTRWFFQHVAEHPWIFGAYAAFIGICVLTTLDSGYIALRWFLQSNARASNHPIFALIPSWLVTSPIPPFVVCGLFALIAAVVGIELEYFMIFYATFFVGYASLGIARAFTNGPANAIPGVKMFCIGSVAVVIFAYGYFLHAPAFLIIGSLLPLGYVIWLLIKPSAAEEFVNDNASLQETSDTGAPALSDRPAISPDPEPGAETTPRFASVPEALAAAAGFGSPAGHFEGKWFVHTFVATYADTNSVGNVYFGMYAMWVGKTRELFFNKVMPKFNLKDTPFYILTRSFEHKFVRETKEFETVSVRIKVASYNRKFATLEHEVYDSHASLLGKGKQTLLFVSSADYRIVDMPHVVYNAFLPLA